MAFGRPTDESRERFVSDDFPDPGVAVQSVTQAATRRAEIELDDFGTDGAVRGPDTDFQARLAADRDAAGGPLKQDPESVGSFGRTMFDTPASEDNTVTVVMHQERIEVAPSQALLRVKSRDGRRYLGIVTSGPFADPDNMRGDSPIIVTVATHGGVYLPPYHGRIQVSILGEELRDGTLAPPRWRPLPNSPVFALDDDESARVLRTDGDIRFGLVVGHDRVVIGAPSDAKTVFPRHTAVLGTTGSGKSTTVSRLVQQAQASGMATIMLDVEGEYTHMHEPTDDARMLAALAERRLEPAGIPAERMSLFHLVGRDTANPSHPNVQKFALQFARISPYALKEIMGLTEAQELRFLKAYDITKDVMRDVGIYPAKGNAEQERDALEVDEFERGYPRMTLSLLMDVVGACAARVDKAPISPDNVFNGRLKDQAGFAALKSRVEAADLAGSVPSWRALLGRLGRLNRLKVFDRAAAEPLHFRDMLRPGRVSVIDLSDTGMTELSNIVIADLLRGVVDEQDDAYQAWEEARRKGEPADAPARVLIVIEEAHEFLSAERADKMPILFEQVARIAKRGRKRWLGLVFVTQLPQHLPRQVFGLVNSFVLHKIADPQVVSTLEKTVAGIDDGLWRRLSGLAPGQAIVSFPHMTRPLLASMDPTPVKLRLVD